MIGKKCGKLTVIQRLKGSKFICKCECGNERTVSVGHFNASYFKSCGCDIWHGMTGSREHISWSNMIARCHNPNNKRYKDYGKKGIIVCDRWRHSFINFFSDMGKCPDKYQIDRIDNKGIYDPSNCRWVSPKANMANRSISRKYVLNGDVFYSINDAAIKFNVSRSTIKAWCEGRCVKRMKKNGIETIKRYPPKNECYVVFHQT